MNERYFKQLRHTSKKKFVFFLIAISLLLLVDYALKVREYNHLISANKIYEETNNSWIDGTGIYFDNCLGLTITVGDGEAALKARGSCIKFVSKSDESAGQLFVQNNQLNRFFVAPWHTKMKYAYEDLSVLIYDKYEYISGWEFVTDPNSSGNNLQNNSSNKISENMLQYNQSLAEAKPFPGLFLDSGFSNPE